MLNTYCDSLISRALWSKCR